MTKPKSWSHEEIDKLISIFPHKRTRDLVEIFGRSYFCIANKAYKLGLKKDVIFRSDLTHNTIGSGTSIHWTNSMIATLKNEFAITTNDDLALILGVSKRSVCRKAKELGLKKNMAWLRAMFQSHVRLAIGQNKLVGNGGKFKSGHAPTASCFKPGHVPATIQPVIRLDTMEVYASTYAASEALGCCQSNVSSACRRKGNARGVALRFAKDMTCGTCRFIVGLSPNDIQGDAICGCGRDSSVKTTQTTGCKFYQPNK